MKTVPNKILIHLDDKTSIGIKELAKKNNASQSELIRVLIAEAMKNDIPTEKIQQARLKFELENIEEKEAAIKSQKERILEKVKSLS